MTDGASNDEGGGTAPVRRRLDEFAPPSRSSVNSTVKLLREVLSSVPGTTSVSFVNDGVLARPPFSFVRAVVRLFVRGLGFAGGVIEVGTYEGKGVGEMNGERELFEDRELDPTTPASRTEKVSPPPLPGCKGVSHLRLAPLSSMELEKNYILRYPLSPSHCLIR